MNTKGTWGDSTGWGVLKKMLIPCPQTYPSGALGGVEACQPAANSPLVLRPPSSRPHPPSTSPLQQEGWRV